MNADGTDQHQLSGCGPSDPTPCATGDDFGPAWSPDGTKIAFAGGLDLDTDGEIYIVNVDGTGLTQVTHTGGSLGPDWGTHPPVG